MRQFVLNSAILPIDVYDIRQKRIVRQFFHFFFFLGVDRSAPLVCLLQVYERPSTMLEFPLGPKFHCKIPDLTVSPTRFHSANMLLKMHVKTACGACSFE